MTELIVALDGPQPGDEMLRRLYDEAGVKWFKVGPQAMITNAFPWIVMAPRWRSRHPLDAKIFLDLKLADTSDSVREAVKRFADAGVAAVSTYTDRATMAASDSAGKELRIWKVHRLTDEPERKAAGAYHVFGERRGMICSVPDLRAMKRTLERTPIPIDKVCPGIRFNGKSIDGHKWVGTPRDAVTAGATHIVVGRPIWQAPDPVAAAKEFLAALG